MSTGPLKKLSRLAPDKPSGGANANVELTAQALERIRGYRAENPEFEGKPFRVYVEGGGCAGFRYGFTFDEFKDDDIHIDCGDLTVVIDPLSLEHLAGSRVHYVSSFQSSGFVIDNPNASASCGCGHSFGV